jgi:pre-mRNA-processing factor 19
MRGEAGAITDAVWVGDKVALGTSTGAVKVYDSGNEVASFSSHAGGVAALATHPTGDILVSVGGDKSYVLYDLQTNSVATQIFTDAGKQRNPFHPQKRLLYLAATNRLRLVAQACHV